INGDLAEPSFLHVKLINAIVSGDVGKAGKSSDAILDYLERFTKHAAGLS
ncbi:MAG: hypothetical protein HY089_09745, partial [Ignavibacteriales bacterium]|nr:hypothetical protein [Ignavibacteriales bacterium]